MNESKPMPAAVADIRRDVCASCDAQCAAYLAGQIDHSDPASACGRVWPRRWGPYGHKRGGKFARAVPCFPVREAVAIQAPAIPVPPAPPTAGVILAEPTVAELAGNFVSAMERWVAAGVPVVSRELYAARAATCDACSLWDGAARFGLGKCKAPGCGCTGFKRWLATEKCTLGKWPAAARASSDAAAAGGSASGGATRA